MMIMRLTETGGGAVAGWLASLGPGVDLLPLGYRPFLDPISAQQWWWLFVIPLIIGIAIVYKALRLPDLDRFWFNVTKMSLQIMIVMVVMSVILYLVVERVLPLG